MDASEIGPVVSAASVMLGAFGFFYNARGDVRAKALALTRSPHADDREAARDQVRRARVEVYAFAAVAFVIGVLFVPDVVRQLDDAFDDDLSLSDYSALDGALVLVGLAWFAIAVLMVVDARRLSAQLQKLA